MKEQQIEEQMWSYIDGSATADEKVFVEKMLAVNEDWKSKYKEQLELHQLLMIETELEQPPLRFAKKCNGANCRHTAKSCHQYIHQQNNYPHYCCFFYYYYWHIAYLFHLTNKLDCIEQQFKSHSF